MRDVPQDFWQTSIDELYLSGNTYRALFRAGVRTVYDILTKVFVEGVTERIAIYRIGERRTEEIRLALSQLVTGESEGGRSMTEVTVNRTEEIIAKNKWAHVAVVAGAGDDENSLVEVKVSFLPFTSAERETIINREATVTALKHLVTALTAALDELD